MVMCTMGNGIMIKLMVKEIFNGLMEIIMMASGKIIKDVGKVS